MNWSSLFGIVAGIGMLVFAIHETKMGAGFFLDKHGIMIVVGGTFAVSSIMFPLRKVISLIKVFLMHVLGKNKVDYQGTIQQMIELNKKATIGLQAMKDSIPSLRHPFLAEAVELVAGGVLSEEEIRDSLEQRLKTIERRYTHEANMFRTIGRFPPAFGLMGTTLAMIMVLDRVGQEGGQEMIGPAMAVGLVATLYGLALSNLVFLPIAENLSERTKEEINLRRMIVEGAVLIKRQINPIAMREELNSFLMPGERVTRKAA